MVGWSLVFELTDAGTHMHPHRMVSILTIVVTAGVDTVETKKW